MTELRKTISIGIYFRGTNLDPENLTNLLEISPTQFFKKGGSHTTVTGQLIKRKVGLWSFESKSVSSNISDHLAEVEDVLLQLALKNSQVKQILGIEDSFIDVFICALSPELNHEVEFTFSPTELKNLMETGLPIRFSVSAVNP